MDDTLYCLVDPQGEVHTSIGAGSFADLAQISGLTEKDCQEYRFDVTARQLLVDRATPASAFPIEEYIDLHFGSPERLMRFAAKGHLPKQVLVDLLSVEKRRPYLEACAQVERKYTQACTAKHDPCLESGCSLEGEDEICLQPLLNAGVEYHQACAAEWIKLFRAPANRIDIWKE